MNDEITFTGSLPPDILTICSDEGMLVQIGSDGTVTYGETYTPDRAAQAFWKALGRYAPEIDSPPVAKTPEDAYDEAMSIIG